MIVVNSDDGFVDMQEPRLAAAQANLPNVGLMRRLPPGSRFSQIHSVGPVIDRLQALKTAVGRNSVGEPPIDAGSAAIAVLLPAGCGRQAN